MQTAIRILTVHENNTFESCCIPSTNISHITAQYEPQSIENDTFKESDGDANVELSQNDKQDKYSHLLEIYLKTGDVLTYNPQNNITVFFIVNDSKEILCRTKSVEFFSMYFMQFCIGTGNNDRPSG